MQTDTQQSNLPTGKIPVVEHKGTLLLVEFVDGQPFFHIELNGWSKSLYKEYIEVFGEVLAHLKDRGFKYVYVCIPNDKKLLKFETMFGFEVMFETEEHYLLVQET